MGITNFNKWLSQNYPQIIKKIHKSEYDNVFIDLNPILHVGINKSKNTKELLKKVKWLTDEILKKIIPQKRIIFSTDGIPSFAKMILQRERRTNMVKSMGECKNTENFINPIILTPGTDFSNGLLDHLEDYFKKLREKYPEIEIIELISEDYGESEFKLFNKMKEFPKERNILVSNDADVVIMALSITDNKKNIYIANNSGNNFTEINLNKFYNMLNLNKLYSNLDFTFLMLLMGNDYLPKLNFMNINKVLPIYYELAKKDKLVINHNKKLTINNKLFGKIIFRLFGKNKSFKINSLEELNFKKIENYLEGLIWCLNDYHNSKCDNMYYMFEFEKLGISPDELYYYLSLNEKKVIEYPKIPELINNIIYDKSTYISIVMPYKTKFLINSGFPDYIYENHKYLYEEELCESCYDYHKKLSDLCITKKYLEDTDCDTDEIKKKIASINMEFSNHKKDTHKKIKSTKYFELINELNNLNKVTKKSS